MENGQCGRSQRGELSGNICEMPQGDFEQLKRVVRCEEIRRRGVGGLNNSTRCVDITIKEEWSVYKNMDDEVSVVRRKGFVGTKRY